MLAHFKEYIDTYTAFYNNKKEKEEKLYTMLASAVHMTEDKQLELDEHNRKNEAHINELEDKKYRIAVAKVLSEKKSLREVEALVKNSTEVLSQKEKRLMMLRNVLCLWSQPMITAIMWSMRRNY